MATKNEIYKIIENHNLDKNGKPVDRIIPLRVDLIDICKDSKGKVSINAAIMLTQLIYWSERTDAKKQGWMYKSETEWYDETRLTPQEKRTAEKILEDNQFIETKLGVAEGHRTKFFRLKPNNVKDALHKMYGASVEITSEEEQPSVEITEPPVKTTDDPVKTTEPSVNLTDASVKTTDYTESTQKSTQKSRQESRQMGASPQTPSPLTTTPETKKEDEQQEDKLINELKIWVSKEYEIVDLPKYFETDIRQLISGTRKNQKQPMKLEYIQEFWEDTFKAKLKTRYAQNLSKGKRFEGYDRIRYDLSILVEEYPAFEDKKRSIEFEREQRKKEAIKNAEEMRATLKAIEYADTVRRNAEKKEVVADWLEDF